MPPRKPAGGRGRSDRAQKVAVDLDVYDVHEQRVATAKITLTPAEGGAPIPLRFDKQTGIYRGTVLPGRYTATVTNRGSERQERRVDVSSVGTHEVFFMGPAGLPSYYRGRTRVPFEPHPDLVGVVLRDADGEADRRVIETAGTLGMQQVQVSGEIRRARGRVFRLPRGVAAAGAADIVRRVQSLPNVEAAGIVVAIRERSMSFLTDELIVCFEAYVTEDQVRRLAEQFQLEILRAVPYSPNTWHFRAPQAVGYQLLDVNARIVQLEFVDWAEPNLVTTAELDAIIPTDFLWNAVWDRQLVNCPDAWQELQDAGLQPYGEPTVIIAAIDQGIQSASGVPVNPEFQGNVSNGSSKTYRLHDFRTLVANNDNPPGDHGMGVAGVCGARADNASPVAGVGEGLAGAAPNCRIMGLIFPSTDVNIADMFIWAAGFDPRSPRAGFPAPISPGADVFTCSIGFGAGAVISGTARAMLDYLTTYGRGGKGCPCFFSTGNANANIAPTHRPWAAYERSFGIAASTLATDGTTEIRAPTSGWGTNIQVCAPSHRGGVHNPPASYLTVSCALNNQGTLIGHATATTVLTAAVAAGDTNLPVASVAGFTAGGVALLELPGNGGWETVFVTGAPNPVANTIPVGALLNGHAASAPVSTGPRGYGFFGGTSSATPLSAGVAALVLSANPALTWIELRQILRDSAVKINPETTEIHATDPAGDFRWRDANGNISLVTGLPPVWSPGYGFGRIDAAAAVRDALVYSFTRDVVVRDNLADVGAVPSGGAFWNSPDIWVRNLAPSADGAAALPANYSSAPPHQAPRSAQSNWVYGRFRNIGTAASLDFYVRFYLTHFPGAEFAYPASFVPTPRPGTTPAVPLAPGTYLIGQVKYANLAPNASDIVNVEWPAALVPPQTVVVSGSTVTWHPCLLIEISPHDGPAATGARVWDNNNIAQKNISIVYVDAPGDFRVAAVIGNAATRRRSLTLELDRTNVPPQIRLWLNLLDSRLTEQLQQAVESPENGECRDVVLTLLEDTRARVDYVDPGCSGRASVTVLPAETRLTRISGPYATSEQRNFRLEYRGGEKVAMLAPHGMTRIPGISSAAEPHLIVIGGHVPEGVPAGTYTIVVTQRESNGTTSGSLGIELTVREPARRARKRPGR